MESGCFLFLAGPDISVSPEIRGACPVDGSDDDSNAQALLTVARALSSSAVWREFDRAALVVRTGAEPHLAVAGFFGAADQARLENLVQGLREDLPRVRYVSYDQAQADCLRLASRLLDRFGSAARDEFHYVAIPRGGHIVLGMLAYALDLPADRLAPRASAQVPLVVVDDCAVSGARFKGLLPELEGDAVIFAPLYSPAGLRDAIRAQEPRVLDCLSARDLEDEAPLRQGAGHAEWQESQRQSDDGSRYWYGQYAPFGFAWNEPDVGFWNPATHRREKAWNLLPPELCLKNRIGWDPDAARIQINADGPGPIVPGPGVLHADFGDTILLGEAGSGRSHALDDVAADMWRALVTTGSSEAALAALCAVYDVDDATLGRDLQAFTETLFDKGLLVRRGDACG
jgi:hypothetical protein